LTSRSYAQSVHPPCRPNLGVLTLSSISWTPRVRQGHILGGGVHLAVPTSAFTLNRRGGSPSRGSHSRTCAQVGFANFVPQSRGSPKVNLCTGSQASLVFKFFLTLPRAAKLKEAEFTTELPLPKTEDLLSIHKTRPGTADRTSNRTFSHTLCGRTTLRLHSIS